MLCGISPQQNCLTAVMCKKKGFSSVEFKVFCHLHIKEDFARVVTPFCHFVYSKYFCKANSVQELWNVFFNRTGPPNSKAIYSRF